MRLLAAGRTGADGSEWHALRMAERADGPYLAYRDGAGALRLALLEAGDERLWIGRDAGCAILVDWDPGVSRAHAELQRAPAGWALVDDGLSRNGSWINEQRVSGRRLLRDRDVVRVGATALAFHDRPAGDDTTRTVTGAEPTPSLTPAQARVLAALCRPLHERGPQAPPASNGAIAEALVISPETVKSHVAALFAAFGLDDVPPGEKRLVLARRALEAGLGRPGG